MVPKKLTEGLCLGLYGALTIGGALDTETSIRWRRYQIMKRMGWNYAEYQQAPAWLVTEIEAFMRTENRAQADSMEKK